MIRLQRVGRKHEPVFRIVLTDSKNSTKSGKFLEVLGSRDPRHDDKTIIKADRVTHWISKGAQVSNTLHNLFITKKVITGKKVNALPKKTAPKKEEVKVEEAPKAEAKAETPAEVEAPVAEVTEAAPAEAQA